MRYLEPESPTPATDKQSLKGVARVRTKSCVLCVVALAATPVSAITIRADRADSQYTSLGNDSKYKSVGYLSWSSGTASAVLISPRWVLTAAHCVDTSGTRSFLLGLNNYTDAQHFTMTGWTGDLNAGLDIGLIRLTSYVPTLSAIPAIRNSTNEIGLTGTSVGFGLTGTGSTGYGGSSAQKRGATNIIDVNGSAVGASTNIILSDFDNPNLAGPNAFGDVAPTDLEGSVAPGDSGGGTFVDIDGKTYLAGIHSYITALFDGNTNASYSDGFGSTRVNTFNQWIDSNIANIWKSAVGTFGNASSWSLGPTALTGVPGANDIVGFDNSSTLQLTFTTDVTNWQAISRRGSMFIDLGGHSWTLSPTNLDASLMIGRGTTFDALARITLTNGTLNTGETGVGMGSQFGILQLNAGAVWNNSGDAFVGGDRFGQRGNGRIALGAGSGAQVNIGGTLRVYSTGSVHYDGGALTVGALDVQGGKVTLAAGGGKVVRTGAVAVSSGGVVDLSDNAMIVDYSGASALGGVQALLATGYAGGTWNGASAINSSVAAAQAGSSHTTALGYAESADIFTTFPGTFLGQSVDDTAILIRYVYTGDTTLDGAVDTVDFNSLASNFGAAGKVWSQGDFNFDFTVDTTDFNLLASNFGQVLSGPALAALVPEPASAGAIAGAALIFGQIRRRRSNSRCV